MAWLKLLQSFVTLPLASFLEVLQSSRVDILDVNTIPKIKRAKNCIVVKKVSNTMVASTNSQYGSASSHDMTTSTDGIQHGIAQMSREQNEAMCSLNPP